MHHRIVIPLVVGAGVLLAIAQVMPGLQNLLWDADRQLLDNYHAWGEKTVPDPNIVLLGIDDASLSLASAWPEDIKASPTLQAMQQPFPWPRRVWAAAIDRLCGAGASLVFLDLAFVAPASDPQDDALFRLALERHQGKVLLGAKFDRSQIGAVSISNLTYPSVTLTGSTPPAPGTFGLLNFWPDADSIVRVCDLQVTRSEIDGGVLDTSEKPLPSIALAASEILYPERPRVAAASIRPRFGPIHAYPPESLHTIFIPDLWQSNFGSGAKFEGKTVFIGATASELQDFQTTTLGTIYGVQLHAHALAALLADSTLQSTGIAWRWGTLFAGVFLAWILILWIRQPVATLISFFVASAALIAVTFWCFDHLDLEASPLPFVIALNLCGAAGLTGNSVGQLREQRKLQRFLARYTSPEFAQEMLQDKAGLLTTLGGVERNVTILFSDVRGFTRMSEAFTPTEIVTQLNEYLSKMVEQVFQKRGLVDKFIGDAVMALWGATRSKQENAQDGGDAGNALSAALGMREALKALNAHWKERGMPELAFGIGIHQGPAVVGNIGSEAPYEKMDLTVIGDSVNLAARLESSTKQYGVDIAISESVYQHVESDFRCRSVDLVQVMGKDEAVCVYTVLGTRATPSPQGIEAYEKGVKEYRNGQFSTAKSDFNQAAEEGLDDYLTQTYQERCAALIESPPEEWNGIYVMTKK